MRGLTVVARVARRGLAVAVQTQAARAVVRSSNVARSSTCCAAAVIPSRRWLSSASPSDSHPLAATALNTIKESVAKHDVVLFMKGIPAVPQCGFSKHVCDLLRANGLTDDDIHSHNVLADEYIRKMAKEYSEWPTFPQLYIKGEFVGGCDIVHEMHVNKELGPLLEGIKKD